MTQTQPTPASLGFRMPAEWEPQEGIWLSWPHNLKSWPGAFKPVPPIFAEMAKEIAESQLVRINLADQAKADEVRELLNKSGVNIDNVRFHLNPTNDSWVRDHGPIYVVRDLENGQRQRAILNWGYNAWGGKYPPYDFDNAIPMRIAEEFKEYRFDGPMILEGGSIDVNGCGTVLTTTACLLNKNRNPHLSKTDIETHLCDYFGVSKVLWLGEGVTGDDTDGHVDDITRFVSSNTIVTAIAADPEDVNDAPLQRNLETLRSMTDQNGTPFEIIRLPMPDPVYFDAQRLPASYANFLICNEKVLVPTYRCDNDAKVIDLLQGLFPTRKVVGIDCTKIIWGLGAIHCLTQQQPRADCLLSGLE